MPAPRPLAQQSEIDRLRARIAGAQDNLAAPDQIEALKARIAAAKGQRTPSAEPRPEAQLTPQSLYEGMASVMPQRGVEPGVVPGIRRPEPQPPLAPSLAGGLVQGVAGSFAGIPESAGIQHQAAQRSLAKQYSRIDRGGRPDLAALDSPAALARVTDYMRGDPATRQRLRDELNIRPIQEEPAFAVGQALRSAAAELAPIDPRRAQSFPVQLARGIGSTGAFVATGLASRLARIPGGLTVAGTGALVNGAEGFRSAVAQGASFEDAVKASRLNAFAGVSEAVPIARIFDRLDAATGGQFRRALTNAARGGGEEAAQEVFQTVFNNLVESDLVGYNPERGLFAGTGEAGGVGFSVGALFNFAASMLGVRPRRTAREFTEHLTKREPGEPRQPRPGTRGPAFERGEAVGPTEPPAPPPAASGFGPVPTAPTPAATEAPKAPTQEEVAARVHQAAEKAVNERQAAEQTARRVPLVGPDYVPQATANQVASGSDRYIETDRHITNGHIILTKQATPPQLVSAFKKRYPPGELEQEKADAVMEQAAKTSRQPFVPLVVRDPSLSDDDSTRPRVYAREGGQWFALDAAYYDYLIRNGFEVRWSPDAPEGHPYGVFKNGQLVGGIMPVRVAEGEIPDLEDAASRFEAAAASPLPIDPNAPKLGRDVLHPPRSAAQVEARARAEVERRFRDKTPPDTRVQARKLQAETIKKLDQLEREARVRVQAWDKAETAARGRLAKLKESNLTARTYPAAFEDGFLGAWRGKAPSREAAGETAAAYKAGRKLGAAYAKEAPPPPNPQETEIEFVLPSATGKGARFKVIGTLENIRGIKSRMTGAQAAVKFNKEEPRRAGAGLPSRNVGGVRIFFPDESHAALIDLAANPNPADAQKLFGRFVGYVEGVRNPGNVIALARDYAAEVRDIVAGSKRSRGGQSDHARLVVDPDRQTRYLQRERLGMTEAELPETAYSVAGSTGRAGEPGANYVDFVPPRVGGAPRATPLRRESILAPLIKDLGVPVYQGRIKNKKILGFARRPVDEVRIRRMSDIEVVAHEMGHILDYRFPEIRKQWKPATKANAEIRAELSGVSYDRTKLFEGFAEFLRLWMTQPAEAQARAPKFSDWWAGFVSRSPHGPALLRAQREMVEWFAQDALTRARSKIGVARDMNAGLTSIFDRLRQATLDDLHGIALMERDVRGENFPMGAYETARLSRAKYSIADGALRYGAPHVLPDGSHEYIGPGLQQILEPILGDLDNALLYFVGRSANELRQQGRENLFDYAEIKAMLELETPAFAEAFARYQEFNSRILDFAETKGIIDPAARAKWKRAQYLPFHRVGQPGQVQAVSGDWRGIKALTGGTDNIRDVLQNMVSNTVMLIDAALTNEARQSVAGLSQLSGGARWMAKIPKEERVVKVAADEIERVVKEALGVSSFGDLTSEQQAVVTAILDGLGGLVPLFLRNQSPLGHNIVAVLYTGKPQYFEVIDPVLLRSLIGLQRPRTHPAVRAFFSWPKTIGQKTITWSVDFLAANFVRDALSSSVLSRTGALPLVTSIKGLKSAIAQDATYRAFLANGGGLSSHLIGEEEFRSHLDALYRRKRIDRRTVIDTVRDLGLVIDEIFQPFETAARLGEFKRAIKAGEHPRHAAYLGREVSTDFAMRGGGLRPGSAGSDAFDTLSSGVNFLMDSVIFLKAAMNGLDRTYRGLVRDPHRGTVALKVSMLAAASVGLYLLQRDNPLFQDLEDWDREAHWHFFIPTVAYLEAAFEGRDLPSLDQRYIHLRMPKIWEIGAIASSAERTVERFLSGEYGKLPADVARVWRSVLGVDWIPQTLKPIYEVAINENRFLERPIETRGDRSLLPFARGGAGTSQTMKELGEATRDLPRELQISPPQAEALLRGYFNTYAAYGLMLSDAMFFDQAPALRVDQYPVLRRFYSETPPRHTRYAREFYDALKEATEVRRTLLHLYRNARPEIVDELKYSPENLRERALTSANKHAIEPINRAVRHVLSLRTLAEIQAYALDLGKSRPHAMAVANLRLRKAWRDPQALKRGLLDTLIERRNALFKEIVTEVEKVPVD